MGRFSYLTFSEAQFLAESIVQCNKNSNTIEDKLQKYIRENMNNAPADVQAGDSTSIEVLKML